MSKPFVVIAIPHTGSIHMEFAEKVYSALKQPSPIFDKSIITSRGLPLDCTRNQLVQTMLADKNATHIMFLDSDVVPEGMTANQLIELLLSCDYPIASASYRAHQKTGFVYAAWNRDPDSKELQFIPVSQWTGNWIPVDVIGCGAVLIERQVFKEVPQPWFVWDDITGKPSEDFAWCLKTTQYANIKPRVLMSAKCSHISGKLKIMWDGSVTTCDI